MKKIKIEEEIRAREFFNRVCLIIFQKNLDELDSEDKKELIKFLEHALKNEK